MFQVALYFCFLNLLRVLQSPVLRVQNGPPFALHYLLCCLLSESESESESSLFLLPLDPEFSWNFSVLCLDFLFLSFNPLLSYFVVLGCLVMAVRTSSFSIYSMMPANDLLKGWKLILIILLWYWEGTIWVKILINSPSVRGTYKSDPIQYSK